MIRKILNEWFLKIQLKQVLLSISLNHQWIIHLIDIKYLILITQANTVYERIYVSKVVNVFVVNT